MERSTSDFRTGFTIGGDEAAIHDTVASVIMRTFPEARLPPNGLVDNIVSALSDAGFEIVAKVQDEPLYEQDEIRLSVGPGETPLGLEAGQVEELPRGKAIWSASAAEFLAAIHGEDGLEVPELSGLSWLRDLLRSARNAGAIQALQGDSDDEGAVYDMLQAVDDMYRRLAPLTGQRGDIFDSENPLNRGEAA